MSTLLDDTLVADALHGLTDWTGDASKISRTVRCEDEDALLASVAEAADALDHHPEIDRSGDGITFTLWTHSKGGVTELDIALASRIDDLLLAVCHKERDALGQVHDVNEPATGRTVIAEPVYPEEPDRYAGANPPTMNEPATPRQDAGPLVVPDAEPGSIEPEPGNAPAPGMHERVSKPRRRL
jgi:4a-hydroxytetrahydrobiopterin dehydratase